MRIFWTIVLAWFVSWVGRLITYRFGYPVVLEMIQRAALDADTGGGSSIFPMPGSFKLVIFGLAIVGFWSFVAALVAGYLSPRHAYRCAIILALLLITEEQLMSWWIQSRLSILNHADNLIGYVIWAIALLPELIVRAVSMFVGAALARRLRRRYIASVPPSPLHQSAQSAFGRHP